MTIIGTYAWRNDKIYISLFFIILSNLNSPIVAIVPKQVFDQIQLEDDIGKVEKL